MTTVTFSSKMNLGKFWQWWVTSLHVFGLPGLSLTKLSPTTNFRYFHGNQLSFVLSRWPYCHLLFCKHFFMTFSCSLFLNSLVKILTLGLTLYIYLTTFTSFLSRRISHHIKVPTQVEYYVSFLVINPSTYSIHSLLLLNNCKLHHQVPLLCHQVNKNFLKLQNIHHLTNYICG